MDRGFESSRCHHVEWIFFLPKTVQFVPLKPCHGIQMVIMFMRSKICGLIITSVKVVIKMHKLIWEKNLTTLGSVGFISPGICASHAIHWQYHRAYDGHKPESLCRILLSAYTNDKNICNHRHIFLSFQFMFLKSSTSVSGHNPGSLSRLSLHWYSHSIIKKVDLRTSRKTWWSGQILFHLEVSNMFIYANMMHYFRIHFIWKVHKIACSYVLKISLQLNKGEYREYPPPPSSGVTPLGSGWAKPRAPGLRGHPSEGEDLFSFFKLYSILLIHNYTLYSGAPLQPSSM